MPFRILETENDLPPPGPLSAKAREKQDLDFKGFADRRHGLEHAKDIAAFANSLGGTLLIGAEDKTGSLVYDGVQGQTPTEVKEIYEAASGTCDPPIAIDVVPILLSSGVTVVAVNVPPLAAALVGAPGAYKDPEKQLHRAKHSWSYPVRRSSQTEFLTPKEIPVYMNPDARRAYVLLDSIPSELRGSITLHAFSDKENRTIQVPASVVDASLERNFALFESTQLRYYVPLREVVEVWQSSENAWSVRVAGRLNRHAQTSIPRYLPVP